MEEDYYTKSITTQGVFKKQLNGYYTFELKSGEELVFEQINQEVIKEYQLKTHANIDMVFELTYIEIYNEFESDDFLIYRLKALNLLSEL